MKEVGKGWGKRKGWEGERDERGLLQEGGENDKICIFSLILEMYT